jgi:hypothetical protein
MDRTEILDQEVYNSITRRNVTVRYALRLTKTHPAYKAAVALINRGKKPKKKVAPKKTKKDDVKSSSLEVEPYYVDVIEHRLEDTPGQIHALDEYGKKHLNGVSPIEIAAKYLSLIYDPKKDAIEELEVQVADMDKSKYPRMRINILLENGTQITRIIKTSTKTGKSVIKNDYFTLGRGIQGGKGLAKKMLQETIKMADAIDAEAVLFEAGLTAGGYVWAKYGAIPTPESRVGQYSLMYPRLQNFDNEIAEQIDDQKDYIKRFSSMAKKKSGESEYYARQVVQMQESLKVFEEAQRFAQENPQFMKALTMLFKKEVKKLGKWWNDERGYHNIPFKDMGKFGKKLSPDLLSYLAQTPVGKVFLLESGWNGYFNMRKGSMGRKMLEKAVNS